MDIQLNLEAHQAIKNLTQAGIDEEQATVLVSTFGNSSNNIATKDDLEVVKQGLTQEMKAMDNKQSQRSDYLEKTLTQQMKAIDAKQSQRSDYLENNLTQQMSAMDDKQSQRSDSLEKTLTQEVKAMEARQSQEMKTMDDKQFQRSEYLEKNLTKEISKSRYVMFAAGAGGALIMLGLYEALGRFLN